MNKSLVLFFLPVLLALFSCGEAEPKESSLKKPVRSLSTEERDYALYAPEIQEQVRYLDSVYGLGLFYFRERGALYFIPATGKFSDPQNGKLVNKGDYKMGLLGNAMDTLLDFKYDKIGNLNGIAEGWIELEKDGKFGLYHLAKKLLIEPQFDAIYPHDPDLNYYMAKVKQGDKYGIIANSLDEAEIHFSSTERFSDPRLFQSPFINKEYLNWSFDLKNTKWKPLLNMHEEFVEGDPEYAGCVILAPSYLVEAKILPEYEYGLMMDGEVDIGFDLYKSKNTLTTTQVSILTRIVEFMYRFTGSRGEIVHNEHLISSDMNGKQLDFEVLHEGTLDYMNCSNKVFRFIDSSLLEVCISQTSNYSAYTEKDNYHYYKIHADGHIEKLSSNRLFQFTEFVKMDSSYFQACLYRQLNDSDYAYPGKGILKSHYDQNDLNWMLAEIYADNRMEIPIKQWNDTFSQFRWYKPRGPVEEEKLSETDRHNANLIRTRLGQMKENEQFWTNEKKVDGVYAP